MHECVAFLHLVPSQFVEDDNFNQQRTIREGSTLQLFCSATGRPQPSITWSYRATDGKHISCKYMFEMKSRCKSKTTRCLIFISVMAE